MYAHYNYTNTSPNYDNNDDPFPNNNNDNDSYSPYYSYNNYPCAFFLDVALQFITNSTAS